MSCRDTNAFGLMLTPQPWVLLLVACLSATGASAMEPAKPFTEDFAKPELPAWVRFPEGLKGQVDAGKATVQADDWSYLLTKAAHENVRAELKFTVLEPAKNFRTGGHGGDWNAYKYHAYDDAGYEVGVLLRAAGSESGYRVQLSTKYQEVALLKYPLGSFLRAVPCELKVNQAHRLEVSAQANELVVRVDGKELLRYADHILPLTRGNFGIGAGSSAKIAYEAVTLTELPRKDPVPEGPHAPDFRVRNWRGQDWVFDGQEPIMLLYTPGQPCFQNVKLKPGFRPVLLWNADWGVSNGGEIKEAVATLTEPKVAKQGPTLELQWQGKNAAGIYETRSRMVVGYDAKRKMYTYDVDSCLEVFKDYHFRYGFDFEHHTPLGPFYSKYLVVKSHDGRLYYRPVYPIDPGGCSNLGKKAGLRMWHGRTNEPTVLASPAVEYDIPETERREANTAVCACMYDTGIAFPPETARAGTKIAVRYRYTGYPPEEAQRVFKTATVYPTPSLDPNRHLIFAEYPKTTFKDSLPLDQPWWGKRPFTSGHNRLPPSYYLEKETGFGSGYAMRLGPGGDCAASLPTPAGPLPKGKYVVSVYARGDNLIGPGGYIDVLATDQQVVHGYTGGDVRTHTKILKQERHYAGNGTFGWKRVGFVTEVPSGAPAIAVGLGNGGTGDLLFTDLEIRPLKEGEKPPEGIAARAAAPPPAKPAPEGALADYRMEEGKGLYVHDYAGGPIGLLELANLDWVIDDGKPALRFADNAAGKKTYPRAGWLDRGLMSHPSYADKQTVAVAHAGTRYSGLELKALTIAAWVKPRDHMPDGRRGDILGLGARRFILSLYGDKAPYALRAAVNDEFVSDARVKANRWQHVAMTAEPADGKKWRIRLFLDGKQVLDRVTEKAEAPTSIPDSLVLGTELFYFHSSYYRGLLGRTLVLDRALSAAQLAELVKVGR